MPRTRDKIINRRANRLRHHLKCGQDWAADTIYRANSGLTVHEMETPTLGILWTRAISSLGW